MLETYTDAVNSKLIKMFYIFFLDLPIVIVIDFITKLVREIMGLGNIKKRKMVHVALDAYNRANNSRQGLTTLARTKSFQYK